MFQALGFPLFPWEHDKLLAILTTHNPGFHRFLGFPWNSPTSCENTANFWSLWQLIIWDSQFPGILGGFPQILLGSRFHFFQCKHTKLVNKMHQDCFSWWYPCHGAHHFDSSHSTLSMNITNLECLFYYSTFCCKKVRNSDLYTNYI